MAGIVARRGKGCVRNAEAFKRGMGVGACEACARKAAQAVTEAGDGLDGLRLRKERWDVGVLNFRFEG
ncbi:MAG: hypothetical protein KGN79_03905 [Acidobacteriota bacterium]|nr:hypothetical protein [Acidobacteriota bacterium]